MLNAEHTALSTQLTDAFDTKIAKRVGELTPIAQAVKQWDEIQNVCVYNPKVAA